jgi:predicted tellurium resistance membrane protein TerC
MTVRRLAGIAGALLVLAAVLAIVSFLLDALRWLLIIAAIVLVVAAVMGWMSRDRGSGGGSSGTDVTTRA